MWARRFWVVDETRSGLVFRHDRVASWAMRAQRLLWRLRNVAVAEDVATEVAGQDASKVYGECVWALREKENKSAAG